MSDVEYYLLEKDGENSKCGVLDLGKCMDSDENSAGESTFPKETNLELHHTTLPASGENLQESIRENNTTNVVGHTQESKGSDDQLLSFISTQESCPDVSPNRDTQIEKDMNVCKSPENMLKDFIDMNVGVGLNTENLHGNGLSPEEKRETAIPKQTLIDTSHSGSTENTNVHSTKVQGEVTDNHANSKSLTEILDDFCSEPTGIMATSEMSFRALVESDEKEKTDTQDNQLQNQEVEMTEIWTGESTEKVIENENLGQSMKVEELKESNADADSEEAMETEEDEANQIDSSEDTNETGESEMDQIGSSEKSEESSEMYVSCRELPEKELDAVEEKVDDKDSEEIKTVANEVDKKMEEEVDKEQNEADDSGMEGRNEEMEENKANSNKLEERGLGSVAEDEVESEVEDRDVEMEKEDSVDEKLREKDVEPQEKDTDVEEENTVDLESSSSTKEQDWDEGRDNMKKTDEVSEDMESDLADDDTNSQEKYMTLIDKGRNISVDTESDMADDDTNSQENSATLIDKEISMDNEEVKISASSEDLEDEEENSQDESLQEVMKGDDEENLEPHSTALTSCEESGHESLSNKAEADKDCAEVTGEKSPDKLENAVYDKNSDAEHEDEDEICEETSIKIQVSSKSSEIIESETKTSSNEKNHNKEAELSETEKEIFEGSKHKSDEKIVETSQEVTPDSADVVSSKEKLQVSDANSVVMSSDRQGNTDDSFVDYDEESIENISKTIKSFTTESTLEKKHEKRVDSNKKADTSQSKQVIMVKTSSNVERVKRKLEEILEKSKGEEDAAIAELQRMKKEKTDILNAITTEMEKLKAILVKGKQG